MRLKLIARAVRPAPLSDMCSQVFENAAIANLGAICFVSDGKREERGFSGAAMRAPLFNRKIRILTDFQVRRIS